MKRHSPEHWHVFICHAGEDKDEVARPLANALKSRGLRVWYDEFSLELGDSLRRAIDRGLKKSRYGAVILSRNFFDKEWPQKELDALVGREVHAKKKIILPVRHEINQETVAEFSPQLADKVAVSTLEGIDAVADKIFGIIQKRKEKAIKPPKNRTKTFVDPNFKDVFSSRLENLTELLKSKYYDSEQVNDLVDALIMLFKERIEKWDVPSVRFATRELFTKLYRFSEEKGFCELYTIFRDLFSYAYSQRRHLIGSMIETFGLILFGSWVPSYNVEKGEKAAKIMLRLGIDFLDKDLTVSKDCSLAIDGLAEDMFEPEILSKEILFGANAFQKMTRNPELQDFVKQLVDWIKTNDREAGVRTYLKDSIQYAEWEKGKYRINVEGFKQRYLLPALEQNINEAIKDYVQFLGEKESEGDEDITFAAEELSDMILAYEFLRPKIAEEIKERVIETKNPNTMKLFKRIVHNNNFLMKIYEGSEMITTLDELIKFFEANSDMKNLDVGVTTYSITMIDFIRKLRGEEKEALKKIAQKYGLQEEIEVTDQGITFEMDRLVYLGHNQHNMRKLIDFLNEINNILGLESFSTGITFKLREIEKKPKR